MSSEISKQKSGLGPVLLTVLLDLLGFGLVIPLISFYAEGFQASEQQAIAVLGVYSVAQFFFAPLWGMLSDRVGRRPIMLMSIAMTSLSLVAFAFSTQLWMLFVFRFLHGAFAANISTAMAYVADVTTPEERAKGMGLIGAAFGVGFTLGPFVGGELAHFGLAVPILLAAVLSAINFVWAWFGLPESHPVGEATKHPRTADPMLMLHTLTHPVVGLAVFLTFAATLAFAAMEYTFPLVAEWNWGLDEAGVGRLFGLIGVIGIVVQGGLTRPLVKRFGESTLITAGYVLNVAGLVTLAFVVPGAQLLGACGLIALGSSLANPSLNALISKGAGDEEQGAVLGVNQSLAALARAVAPWIALLFYSPEFRTGPFLVSAVIMALALALAIPATRRVRRQEQQAAEPSPG